MRAGQTACALQVATHIAAKVGSVTNEAWPGLLPDLMHVDLRHLATLQRHLAQNGKYGPSSLKKGEKGSTKGQTIYGNSGVLRARLLSYECV